MRLFSADYRAARRAEVDGDLHLAALHYARAGAPEKAAALHLLRAQNLADEQDRIAALEDALAANSYHEGDDRVAIESQARLEMGEILSAQLRRRKIVSQEDRDEAMLAAEHLAAGGDYLAAGSLCEEIEALTEAAQYYEAGGHIHQLEHVLGMTQHSALQVRERDQAREDYLFYFRHGERSKAREALALASTDGPNAANYRSLLTDLNARALRGIIDLSASTGTRYILSCHDTVTIGRAVDADLTLPHQGLSRRHAQIGRAGDGNYYVRDLGSKNGTRLARMPVHTQVTLPPDAELGFGTDAAATVHIDARGVLRLSIDSPSGDYHVVMLPLEQEYTLTPLGLPAVVWFDAGVPILRGDEVEITFNGLEMATGSVEMLRGDVLLCGGVEVTTI